MARSFGLIFSRHCEAVAVAIYHLQNIFTRKEFTNEAARAKIAQAQNEWLVPFWNIPWAVVDFSKNEIISVIARSFCHCEERSNLSSSQFVMLNLFQHLTYSQIIDLMLRCS